MQPRAAIQGTFQYRPPQGQVHARGRQRAKSRTAAPRTDTRAFLNDRILPLQFCDTPLMREETSGLCASLASSCKRLFRFTKDGFAISGEDSLENLVCIIENMEKWAANHNLSFTACKSYEDEISFVLYRSISCLEYELLFFFIAPVESLPEKTASLYKRFIRFASASLGISVMPSETDNQYLDMLLFNDGFYDDEQTYFPYNDEKTVKLFEEVRDACIEGLKEDLLEHWKDCDFKCNRLVELMIDGMEILPCINVDNYDFNPYRNGYDESDGEIEIRSTMAVLYSHNDGIEESLVECVNSDTYSGLTPQGWNLWLTLTPDITQDDFETLMSDESLENRFLNWAEEFYTESAKWDSYTNKNN